MGFFSSASFYRPGTPPAVKACELADFLKYLSQTEFAKDSKLSSANINWGDEISEGVRPFDTEEDENSTTHQ